MSTETQFLEYKYDKIILIASVRFNEKQLTKISKINSERALIVVFNTCYPSQMKIFNGKYHLRFLRGFKQHVRKDFKIKGNPIKDAKYFICRNLEKIQEANGLTNKPEILKVDDYAFNDKTPSLGYIGYKMLRDKYLEIPIYLLGFTFVKSRFHDYKKEKHIMTNDPRVTVV